jgi:superfamily II RNA helicase
MSKSQKEEKNEKKQSKEVIKFKHFTLDPFQIEAVHAIEKNESVVVTAQTGSGKTLIADYIIDKFMHTNKRVIYTAPIKALSNQKFRDFKEAYGPENVGIMTGDVVINSNAPILIMTTEIYRNMLLCNDPCIAEISYVVFDEIHFINDIERGTIWEESLIFSPRNVRFLCLSATIPNAREFADWIESIQEHKVRVVTNTKRVVPLKHLLFDAYVGIGDIKKVQKHIKEVEHIPDYNDFRKNRRQQGRGRNNRGDKKKWKNPSHIELIRDLQEQELLPTIFFIFSRKACQEKSTELAKVMNFTDKKDVATIIQVCNKHITSEIRQLESAQLIKRLVQRGIAFHHAGLLPQLKELVEELFSLGLIKALYATETFAVGINMPAKAVCFNSLEKYDGISFRYLHTKEYFQLAGRAGRRGIDKVGYAIALFNRNSDDLTKIEHVTEKDVEPIISQFTLSYNTVLSLLKQHDHEEIETILKKSFDCYLKKKQNKNIRIMGSFANKVRILKKFGYVNEDNTLTQKGEFARMIYAYELIIADLCTSDTWKELDDVAFLTAIATIMWEGRRGSKFYQKFNKQQVGNALKVLGKNAFIFKKFNVTAYKNLHPIISHWYNGGSFVEMMDFTNLLEGDYIRMFRQLIDMCRQIKRCTGDYDLVDIVERCMIKTDRDIVKVEL